MKAALLTPGLVYRVRTAHSGTAPAVALEAGMRVAFDPLGAFDGRTVQYAPRGAATPAGYALRPGRPAGVLMIVTHQWSAVGPITAAALRELDAAAAHVLDDELPDPMTGGEGRRLIDAAMTDDRLRRLASVGLVVPRNIVEPWPRETVTDLSGVSGTMPRDGGPEG